MVTLRPIRSKCFVFSHTQLPVKSIHTCLLYYQFMPSLMTSLQHHYSCLIGRSDNNVSSILQVAIYYHTREEDGISFVRLKISCAKLIMDKNVCKNRIHLCMRAQICILSGAHEGRRPEGASNYDLCVQMQSTAGPYMAHHKIPDT